MKNPVRYLVLVLFAILSMHADAQIVFSKEYGGSGNEDGRWMEQLPDSGYIMVGKTDTYSNGQSDIWVVRTDANGNVMWTKSYGGAQFEFGNMIKLTSDGGFIIAGFTNTIGAGGNDAWLIKTDHLGNVIWDRTFGDSGLQEFEAVIQTSDGGYAALGVDQGPNSQWYDFYMVKVNAAGTTQFIKRFGGQGYEIGNSIQQTPDGGFILAGQSYSYDGEDGDYYMVKTDSLGNFQWMKNYAMPGLQECHYVQVVPSGGFILVGDADNMPNSLGSTDIWMIRTNDLGDTLWTKLYGGSKKDGGKTVENTSDGGFVVAGITRSFNLINPNYYLFKTNSNGFLEWSNYSYGTAYHDHAYRAIETSDGGFAEFGYFRNASGAMNYALVKLAPNGGVTKDVAIDNFNTPLQTVCRSLNSTVSITLTNYGQTNETNIPVTLQIANASTTLFTLDDTLRSPLAPAASSNLSFTQKITFPSAGTYYLTAYIHHRSSDISYTNDTSYLTVTVVDPVQLPTTVPGLNCSSGTVTISATPASPSDSLFWYTAATGGDLVYMGSTYTTPSLSSSTTYYVEALRGVGNKAGPADNTIGGGGTSTSSYLKFDSRTNWILVSVKVYASTTGNRTIEFRNAAGTVLQSKTVNLPVGESRVYLNFNIPPGNDFQLGLGSGSGALFRNNSGVSYPYAVSRVLEIYGSSGGSGSYYYFYDWHVYVPYENCGSSRRAVTAQIGSGSTTAFDQSRCGTGTVTLRANSSNPLQWYSAPSGGTLLGSGSTYTTPSISSTNTYYLDAGSCSNRIAVQAIVNAVSAAPSASNVQNCGPGSVTLNATASDPVSWFDAASNGLLLSAGNSYTTPYLTSTTNYFAVAGTVCPSSPVQVSAIINSAAPPTVTNASACGPASVTLTASSSNPIEWYNAPSGGSLVGTGPSFTTPVLNSTATYYAQSVSTCVSARTAATATITVVDPPTGSNASRCGTGSLVVSAASIDPVTWWSAASGGTQLGSGINFTTPVISSTTTYYAQASNSGCNSARTAVLAQINVTAPPVASNVYRCGPGQVVLTASSPDSISWYDAPSGGNLLGTGSSFTTPNLSSTTTYYVQAGVSCLSARVPVDAVISSTSANPTVTAGSRCGSGSVQLSASSPDPLSWFDAPNGNQLGSGGTFNTPSISTNTTYYAVAGVPGCYSSFIPVTATVNPLAPSPSVTNAQSCGAAMLTLTATATNPITWYDAATGGNVIGTGNTYQSTFSVTTTVYAQAFNGTCPSNPIPATATIHPVPNVVLGPDTIFLLTGQNTTLNAGPGYTNYLWNTGATSQTLLVTSSGVYNVTVTDPNGCTGMGSIVVNYITGINEPGNEVLVTVYPNPTSGKLNMQFKRFQGEMNIRIVNAVGQTVFTETLQGGAQAEREIDLSSEAIGVYYLRIFSNDVIETRTVIIQ
ncbi:MAG: T9SS C-terminal target domain-containing protein [Bacteroidetes bacterium]|nr:MAG: T9SS C-terminal target domain-containing protein [Bacteroidota bacterium]REK00607.1 MAG: T9SS C-terminal target domain-containing protein [Bacteroidota bacterium]REK35271.1 MAG: T9SS C-terminal target domain-containing protein [Bacteroidota bacterium]REK48347.1 MAG: T9SS C-terminal target domain-containing protein [Bacteroidota bacterium]